MKLRDLNWEYLALRMTETSSWLSINAGLAGLGIVIPDPTFHKIEAIGIGFATLAGVILPQIGKPIATDVGEAKRAAGIPLASSQSAPDGTAPAVARIPVSTIGEKT